ncbi:unnamed protein product, partial [Echinostoma caproni]|uniref:RALGAPB n=1 Tax=Echinostoma caproni TaxID=27848 RepID=A0A183ANR2_9TREM
RNGAGDGPRRSSGRRRRREECSTTPSFPDSHTSPLNIPPIRPAIAPVVESFRQGLKSKTRSPSVEIHEQLKPPEPVIRSRPASSSRSFVWDERAHPAGQSSDLDSKNPVPVEQTIAPSLPNLTDDSSTNLVPIDPKALDVSSVPAATEDNTEETDEWRDVTPRRRERRRSRHSSKQSESGTPISLAKRMSPSPAPSATAAASTPSEVTSTDRDQPPPQPLGLPSLSSQETKTPEATPPLPEPRDFQTANSSKMDSNQQPDSHGDSLEPGDLRSADVLTELVTFITFVPPNACGLELHSRDLM